MLKLHDTLTRSIEEIEPSQPGRVTMYTCGPTVYRPAHVGNLRSYIFPDIIRRTLAYHGLECYQVINITDVGHMTDELTDEGRDRMLLAAEDEGLSAPDIAEKYTEAFKRDTQAINIRPADIYPKATDHIPQILELVAKLIEREHAYEKEGTVYYDVTTFPDYGKLSHQSLEDMRPGHRIEADERKRNHQDFVLWVAAGPRRELTYDSPWGKGYPGWHIECSAMSMHYLGERFDIHTGGVDNRFPHHEDEIAQSEGAVGHPVVGTWVHGEHLLMGNVRMAKSARNVILVKDLVDAGHDPIALRYLSFTARYRRQVHYTDDAFNAAATTIRRLREQIAMLGAAGEASPTDEELRSALTDDGAIGYHQRFVEAVDDDLDLPTVLTVLHEAIGDDDVAPAAKWQLVASWDEILGLDLVASQDVDPRVAALIAERETARSAGNYARADAIRDELAAQGIDLLDSPSGTRWVRRRG